MNEVVKAVEVPLEVEVGVGQVRSVLDAAFAADGAGEFEVRVGRGEETLARRAALVAARGVRGARRAVGARSRE